MKRVEIVIPDGKLKVANELISDANTGGMSYYKIEGRGGVIAEYASRTHDIPEFIPRIKVEVVVKDERVEELVNDLLSSIICKMIISDLKALEKSIAF